MEEMEVPTERLHETINEKAESEGKEGKWSLYVAISTALMAVFAAISSMMAGHHADEAVIEQIQASDQWAFYQAKSIKAEMRGLLKVDTAGQKSPKQAKQEEEEVMKQAKEAETQSGAHLQKHVILARAVTLLQIAIAVSAVAILTRRKTLWMIAIVIALGGVAFFLAGML